jgi:hypothetical protein
MQSILQVLGTALITHSLWIPGAVFSTEICMRTNFPARPRITTYISPVGLVLYALSYTGIAVAARLFFFFRLRAALDLAEREKAKK